MAHELLNHPAVLKTIRFELLRGGYPKGEIEDGIREVVAEAYEYLDRTGEKVETPERMCAIVREPSYLRGVDALRANYTRKKYFGDPTPDADLREAPASSHDERIDMRRAIEQIGKTSKKHDVAIMQGLADGLSQKEIADNLRLSHKQVRKATGSMRERHLTGLHKAGFGGLIAGVLVLMFLLFKSYLGPNQEAQKPEPLPQPSAPPAPPPQVPVATGPSAADQKQKAADLRATAHAAYLKKDWKTCDESYKSAIELDEDAVYKDDALSNESKICTDKYLQMLEAKPR